MESRVKFFGHPVHPMLIVLPAGLFISTVIMDILYLVFHNPVFSTVAFYMMIIGVIGGLLAAIFGFIDWSGLPSNSRARNIGLCHGLGNFIIVVLFGASWFLRRGSPGFVPSGLAMTLSFAGILLALMTLWIGGELVYRLGVAVDRGANVNAPSSLKQSSAVNTKERTMNR